MKKLHILFLSILPALVILFCFLGFLAAPNDPEEVVITQSFLAPCAEYPLGTDQYGRCVLSRILYGGYTTLGIVLLGSAIVMTAGVLLGLLLGQGKAGHNVLFESILNAVTAIPPIAYLIIFISTWGNSVSTMVVALTVSLILRMMFASVTSMLVRDAPWAFSCFRLCLPWCSFGPLARCCKYFFRAACNAWAVSLPVFMDRAMVFWVTSSCNMNPSLLQKIQSGS